MLIEQKYFFNRDISWLSFNYRVLEEAKDESLPLYERIKFLAIYSSNLDEYYKVRVAYYRSLLDLPPENRVKLKYDPDAVLKNINDEVGRQLTEYGDILTQHILPKLRKNNIILYYNENGHIHIKHREYINNYFFVEVLPHIQPVLLEKGNILSFLQDNVIYLAIRLFKKTRKNKVKKRKSRYAIIKIPTHHLPRFIELPEIDHKNYIIFLDDIIRCNLHVLFPGYVIDSCHSIKVSRNADLLIDDDFQGDFVEKIRESIRKRKTGAPSRFLYDRDINKKFLKLLQEVFNLSPEDLVPGGRYHNFSDLFGLPNPLSPKLECQPIVHLNHKGLDHYSSMIEAIKERDWLLHVPYHSYKYVIKFLNEAAVDPKVEEIKTTQYRVATNSAIVSALISAARNGKKVTVFVEVQARFDEENNLFFSKQMKDAGIKVLSSIQGLKVHAKVALVLRRSSKDKQLKGFSFFSTGNFNEKTAKQYADLGFFTYNQDMAKEADKMFDYLEKRQLNYTFKHLLIAQFNMKNEFIAKIDREIENVKKGKKGYMILKMNGLEEPKIIKKLYEAGQKGVKIDLIVRGVNRLIPNQPYSPNIRIIRIIDRFLEHARIYVYYNDGEYEIFIASADWMKRNLNRRVETGVPIRDPELKQELLDGLKIQLADNTKARLVDENLNNIPIERKEGEPEVRAQMDTYKYYIEKENAEVPEDIFGR